MEKKEKEEIYSLKEFFVAVEKYYQNNFDYYKDKGIEIIESRLVEIKKMLGF